ncbi:MAG: glycosyltransferase family protein [Candidatus Nucleicultricaceae bacterium]
MKHKIFYTIFYIFFSCTFLYATGLPSVEDESALPRHLPKIVYEAQYLDPDKHPAENESLTRFIIAAKNLNWTCVSTKEAQDPSEDLSNAVGVFLHKSIAPEEAFNERLKDIPLLFMHHEFRVNITLEQLNGYFGQTFNRFVGCLITPSTLGPLPALSQNVSTIKFVMPWYSSVQLTDLPYREDGNRVLLWSGGQWANQRLSSTKYVELWKGLDQRSDFDVYGHPVWKGLCPNSYKGFIPSDGESFVKKINQAGICLVLHAEGHLKEGIPTGRIFEAAAAKSIIISDKHDFVVQYFGDHILYVNEKEENLLDQVTAHLTWIAENPEKAEEKALGAYKIFSDLFTLEKQLKLLEASLKEAKVVQ